VVPREIAPALDVARRAEDAGIDQLSVVDHILTGEDFSDYPYGKFEFDLSNPWWEPVTLLAALAAVTRPIPRPFLPPSERLDVKIGSAPSDIRKYHPDPPSRHTFRLSRRN
jgi:hypothetical protein